MRFAKWAVVGVGVLVVFALGLWLGSSGLTRPNGSHGDSDRPSQPSPQISSVPLVGPDVGASGGQPPPIRQAIPTPAVSGQSQVPMPPVRSVDVAPEAAAVKGDPEAPVTIVEYSDYQ